MDQSSTFARHFSRLVWLLMNESGSVDEQKMALRALVQVSRVGAVELVLDDSELRAGDAPVPAVLTGVRELVSQMAGHSLESVHVDEATGPADLLGLARIIAAAPVANDGGISARRRLGELAATGIRFVTTRATDGANTEAPTAPMTPAGPAGPEAGTPTTQAAAPPESPAPASGPPPANASEPTPVAAPAVPMAPLKKMSEASAALLAQLSGRAVTGLSPEELLEGLDATVTARDLEPANKVLDDLVTLAEHSARAGKPAVVSDILHGVVTRQRKLNDGEIKGAFVLAMRRLSKPALLRAVAGLVIKEPGRRQMVYEVLRATDEDGANALIEQVGQARNAEERQALVEMLAELADAVPALVRMLGDSRWFVVRNAADLLGEMSAAGAESALVGLLRHQDDRVRRAATSALLKLGTPDAMRNVYDAMNDDSPDVRIQVAAAISTRKDAKTSATLIRAIEGESDADVQLAMIAALGKVATPEAVQKLAKLAEAEGRLFRKKDSGMRVAAVLALGEARSPAAINALKELSGDKDKEVRETAARALAQIGR